MGVQEAGSLGLIFTLEGKRQLPGVLQKRKMNTVGVIVILGPALIVIKVKNHTMKIKVKSVQLGQNIGQ